MTEPAGGSFVSLAGLFIRVENVPASFPIPVSWRPFWRPVLSSLEPVLTVALIRGPCPVEPGFLLNTNPHFQLYQAAGEPGLLGRPIIRPHWTAWYRPEQGRLELYTGGDEPDLNENWVDRLLWRFRTFVLARHDRIVFHATAAVRDGQASLFTGNSGCGKSTLAGLLNGAGWTILSDESPMTGPGPASGFQVWGSPWPSSGGFADAESGGLAALYLLEHGPENRVTDLTPGAAAKRILGERLALCPWYEAETRDRILANLDRMVSNRPCRVLAFKPDASVASFLARF